MDGDDHFRRLSRLFDEVVELPPEARDARLGERCGGDEALEAELRELLAADATGDPDSYMARVVASEAATLMEPGLEGARLGSWRIVAPLGEGGMGTVYRAERADGAYEADAAVKLVRGGLPSPLLSERFRSERQILAQLTHPGIAQLLDGGSTADGTPYLVMELVDGLPIDQWCEVRDLTVADRLRLFLKVCDSVAYAHAALVAHRDLKPNNILVTDSGDPKLLDFGIAKLVDAMADGLEGATVGGRALTPAYASPEQMAGRRAGVAADVYSLGVLLFRLLSGRLPIEASGLTPLEFATKVSDQVPPVVSAVSPAERRRRVSGDLDAIVSRALRKEPHERYASVESLADDVRLHLEGLPIKARRDDWAYRMGKMVRRNRGMVTAGLLVLMLGVSFTVSTFLQARALARERDRAEAQRVTAERVSAFLEEILTEADPNEATGQEVTARQVLDRGADRVLDGLRTEPEIQASIATVMGRVYRRLGVYGAAEPLLDSALSVRRSTGAGVEALGESLLERAALAYDLGEYEEALALATTALDEMESAGVTDGPAVAGALDWMSVSLMDLGRMEEAEQYAGRVVETWRRVDGEPNADLAAALVAYEDVLRGSGKFDEALEVGQEALRVSRAVFGNEHLQVANALNQLASTLSRAGRPSEAVGYAEEGLEIRRSVFPGAHVETAASLGNLANVYAGAGRMEEAEGARRASLEMVQTIFPGEHPYVAASLQSLGSLLLQMERVEEAEPVLLESLAGHRAVFGPGHPNLGYPLTSLGRLHLATGRPQEALVELDEAYRARSNGLPSGHWHVAATGLELGRALEAVGRDDEAESYLTESHATLLDTFGPDDARVVEARVALREHLLRRGLNDRARVLEGDTGPA